MHRFEGVQHLSRDGRPSFSGPNSNYYNCSPYGLRSILRGDNMLPHYQEASKAYPPPSCGRNPRLAGILSSPVSSNAPGAGFGSYGSPALYNRMSMAHHQTSGNFSGGSGQGVMEGMGGYSQKMGPPYAPPPSSSSSFGNMRGYGTVGDGNSGVGRYHPYQQQHQQQRSGFLEQLLKNRGSQQHGYHPYGRSSSSGGGHSSSMGNQFYSDNNNLPGYRGMHSSPLFPYAGAVGNMSRSANNYPPPHFQHQYNWSRGGVLGGVGGGYPSSFHHVSQQNGGGLHYQNPFHNHPHHLRSNTHFLPIIKNESEESGAGSGVIDQPDAQIQKSEARYRRNHERMHAIMNESMADCNPIHVPMTRVDSLRRHVRLLTDETNKHKEDTKAVKEQCSKRLQDLKESTERYHSDYKKLCQPIGDEEYEELVEKYYKELKEKLKQQSVTSSTGGGRKEVADAEIADENNETGFIKEEEGSGPPSPSGGKHQPEMALGACANNINLEEGMVAQDDYFEHPLFIDIPEESGERVPAIAPQQQQLYNQSQGHLGLYPTPPLVMQGATNFPGESNQMQFGGNQQQMNYSYYPPGSASMGHLLVPAHTQPPPPPPIQQQPYTRGYPMTTTSSSYAYQNPSGAYGHLPQQAPIRTQHHPQLPPPPEAANQQKRQRPTEELREFLMGLVREKYQGDSEMSLQVPQLEQHGEGPTPSTSSTRQEGPQQCRFMSGGGIVQVRSDSPQPQAQHQPSIYDDAATREWINSLASDASADASGLPVDEDDDLQEEAQDDNNNLQLEGMVDSSSSADVATNNNHLSTGKHSKIAEILESPCLNDTAEEFESELRQLEDALNVSIVEAPENQADNDADDKEDEQDDNDVVEVELE